MKQAVITFLRPAESHVTLEFKLDEETVAEVLRAVRDSGRSAREFEVHAVDERGQVCATVRTDIRILCPVRRNRVS